MYRILTNIIGTKHMFGEDDCFKFIDSISKQRKKMSDNVKVAIISISIIIIMITTAVMLKSPHKETASPSKANHTISASIPPGIGNEITITFAGDIMCHDGQLLDADTGDGSYDFSNCFSDIAPYINSSSISFANLEGIIAADTQEAYGYPYYYMPEELAEEIANIGFDVISTNNVQCANAGELGLVNTKNRLSESGMAVFGADEYNPAPIIVTSNGISIGFIPLIDPELIANSENGAMAGEYLNLLTYDTLRNNITSCKNNGADIIVLYIRWDAEADNVPTKKMKAISRYAVSVGADIIVGGGSHTVMPIEVITADDAYDIGRTRKGYAFYSLGNFISNQRTNSGDMGAIVTVTIRKLAADSTRIMGYETMPIYTNVDMADGHNFKVVPVTEYSSPPSWMDDSNSDRYRKVFNIVDTILNTNNISEKSRS